MWAALDLFGWRCPCHGQWHDERLNKKRKKKKRKKKKSPGFGMEIPERGDEAGAVVAKSESLVSAEPSGEGISSGAWAKSYPYMDAVVCLS
jgi:hypothetical protein